jgi:hypothetical protein
LSAAPDIRNLPETEAVIADTVEIFGNLDIFPLIFEILILKIIGQCEVKHDVTLPIKTITSILKVKI